MTLHSATSPSFVVPLRDLDDGPKTLSGEISFEWLNEALKGTEATPGEAPGKLQIQLSKNGREVLVRGSVRVPVVVPCARTLAPIPLELSPEILLLLRRAEPLDKRRDTRGEEGPRQRGARSQKARTHGRGHSGTHASPRRPPGKGSPGKGGWAEDPQLEPLDAAQDTFQGEQIVLDSFLREFILLELPMFPVRQDLPSLPVDARASAPDSSAESATERRGPAPNTARQLDPRLAPLAELKDRMRQKKNKE